MTLPVRSLPAASADAVRRPKVVWGLPPWAVAIALLLLWAPSALAAPGARFRKLDPELNRRAAWAGARTTKVVVTLKPGSTLPASLQRFVRGPKLRLIDGYVLDIPDAQLASLEALPQVSTAHQDRTVWAADYLSTRATAANVVHQALGYTGAGVGVAVIDSGITSWHDDLTATGAAGYPYGNQRVSTFVDFVNGQTQPYDDHGHGSHVAGIILGNGYDSNGRHAGIAPDASLIALKVLDGQGRGTISTVIAALDWIAANGPAHNIRVVNLSVGAAVTQSYWLDPLTLAAKRLTDRGIVVVAAAGNLGKNADGEKQYGGILAPGNAPWVLTVGASSTAGTTRTQDDTVASFSSLGPTRGDYLAKPDLVAPGHGVISLSSPGSLLYTSHPDFLVEGKRSLGYPPYLSLSGTSMAAPQVAGAVALMLQANPGLTPNLVKGILQYTAEAHDEYDALQQGAGFLNAHGAVRLAKFYAQNTPGSRMPVQPTWSQHILWGNYELTGGYLNPLASAWAENIVWGTASGDGHNIVWGTLCGACSNIVWGAADANGANIVWGTAAFDNIVWGTADPNAGNIVWGTASADNIVWGTASAENIVWGTASADNIVWGTASNENIVWGTDCGGANCTNIVWGTASADNIVWGTASPYDNIVWGTASNENIVWGTASADNIVWGTADPSAGNIVWGTASADNIVWGTASNENIVWGTASADNIVWGTGAEVDNVVWGLEPGQAHAAYGR